MALLSNVQFQPCWYICIHTCMYWSQKDLCYKQNHLTVAVYIFRPYGLHHSNCWVQLWECLLGVSRYGNGMCVCVLGEYDTVPLILVSANYDTLNSFPKLVPLQKSSEKAQVFEFFCLHSSNTFLLVTLSMLVTYSILHPMAVTIHVHNSVLYLECCIVHTACRVCGCYGYRYQLCSILASRTVTSPHSCPAAPVSHMHPVSF